MLQTLLNYFMKHFKLHKILNNLLVLFVILGISCYTIPPNYERARIAPLTIGHSHNDYEHEKPLTDALALGFVSIEADIHLKNGELFVAHDAEDIVNDRTLKSMYLEPLRKLAERHDGYIFQNKQPIFLFIDQKTNADSTYQVLHKVLESYKSILSCYENGSEKAGVVRVIISGERPIELMRKQSIRYAALDGRLDDLEKNEPVSLFPLVSNNWEDLFEWEGYGDFPENERLKLHKLVRIAHQEGRLIRFWATDAKEERARQNMWHELIEAKVDLINTDYLEELRKWYLKYNR